VYFVAVSGMCFCIFKDNKDKVYVCNPQQLILFNRFLKLFSIRQINPLIRLAILDLKALLDLNPELKQRELEKKGTEILLDALFTQTKAILYRDTNNKPHLSNYPGHISISHSHERLAIIHNLKAKTGIDIELIREKVKAIQHKFLNEGEQAKANNDTETLVCFWAVKETLYKIYGTKGIDFRKNLFIDEVESSRVLGSIKIEDRCQKFSLIKEKIDEYMLVYAEKEI
jgi:4'-phosphopantetheinyl transferase